MHMNDPRLRTRLRSIATVALAVAAPAGCDRGGPAAFVPDLLASPVSRGGQLARASMQAEPTTIARLPGVHDEPVHLADAFAEVTGDGADAHAAQALEAFAEALGAWARALTPPVRPGLPSGASAESLPAPPRRPNVVVYGIAGCAPCRAVRRHLEARGVAYEYRDVEAVEAANRELRAKLSAGGVVTRAVPVTDVDGRLVVGANLRAIDRELRRHRAGAGSGARS
jgi:glutaredoxin